MTGAVLAAPLGMLRRAGLGVPLILLALLAMVVVPLPPLLLDAFFTFNIALSLVIILAVVYVPRPLDFAVFPTVLLGATLLRLALNVASTRIVLLEGHTGPDAAGKVIEAFGAFVVGGNYAVGLVVFVILVIINFAVVTKGAGRVSEVSARFTLDALPGKQMAIDADLNAGLLTADQALARRNEIREEADFYGAMDGASKFVRGDAIAGVLILVINIVGGLIIGTLDHGLPFAEAGRTYTLLTIGDGLVAQIPSLLLSTAVAIIVTRMSRAQTLADQIVRQTVGQPRSLLVAGSVLAVLGILPGMPNMMFLVLAAAALTAGWELKRRAERAAEDAAEPLVEASSEDAERELGWDDVKPVDPIGLDVGYRLVPLVDKHQAGPLLARIKAVRRKLSEQLGFLVHPVHIRDNLELRPSAYRIAILGVPAGEGEIHVDRELAINPGGVTAELHGIAATDPAFGLPAYWIEPGAREHAQMLGYTVVDPSIVIATHLSEIVKRHAHQLFGHEETQRLLDRLAKHAPKLAETLIGGTLSIGVVANVLKELLADGVSLRNFRPIAETLAEHSAKTQDSGALLARVREALGPTIVQSLFGTKSELSVVTLDPSLEQLLKENLKGAPDGMPSIEPTLADKLVAALADAARQQEVRSAPPVLLVSGPLRPWLARLTRYGVPTLKVLAYGEIPLDKSVRVATTVGG